MGNAIRAVVARDSGRLLYAILFILAFVAVASPSGALPLPVPKPVPPSQTGGGFESAWVAPFVQYSWANVSGKMTYCVRWYSESGEVESETDRLVSPESPFGFYFMSGSSGHAVIHGMYGDWKVKSPGESINVHASPNGRTLVLAGRNNRGKKVIVIFIMGQEITPFGSLRSTRVTSVRIGDDGSLAALLTPMAGEAEAVVTDARGKLRIRVLAPGVSAAQPGPDGQCAILWRSTGELVYVEANGERQEMSPPVELASGFARWLPGSRRVLLGNIKQKVQLLFDFEEQRVVWQTEAPAPLNPLYAVPFGDYVFQSGLQAAPTKEEPEGKVRIVRALDILTGAVVATWVSSPPERYESEDIGKLMIRDQRLYFVTDDAFSEISPGDVIGGCWILEKGK